METGSDSGLGTSADSARGLVGGRTGGGRILGTEGKGENTAGNPRAAGVRCTRDAASSGGRGIAVAFGVVRGRGIGREGGACGRRSAAGAGYSFPPSVN